MTEPTVQINELRITVQAPDKPLFLSVQRAAEECGYRANYIRRLIRIGALPAVKAPGRTGQVRIRTEHLIAYMDSLRRIEGLAEASGGEEVAL